MIGRTRHGAIYIAILVGVLILDTICLADGPRSQPDGLAFHTGRSVVDDTERLFIPEGESYELGGRHVYATGIDINGTLTVTPYDGADSSTGSLELEAPRINIGSNGRIIADGRGYGGGGGATENMADVGGGTGGIGGKGGNGEPSPTGSSKCGGGGGGSTGGLGGAGGPPGRDGADGTESGGGKGGDYFNGYTGNYGGGKGGTGFGGGGGGGAGYGWGGGGGGGGGSGGKNASGQTGGDGVGIAKGKAGRSTTMPRPESNGEDGGYMSPGQNGDTSIDFSLEPGSGGGGGGTGAMYSGGGGGGGAGGGAVILDAIENISILGLISTTGSGGGQGGLEVGNANGGSGGNGGGGGGGGILVAGQNITIFGALDARGREQDALSERNGGSIKIFYTRWFISGNITSGRTYTNGRPLMQGLLFPQNDTGTVGMPLFKWKPAYDPDHDAVTYRLQIANDSGFGSPWIDLPDLSEPQALPPFALAGQTLFWRVRASDYIGPGPWSETGRFSIDSIPPVSRVDGLPGFVNWTDVEVTWNGTDAQTGIANYTIYLSVDGNDYQAWQNRTDKTSAVLLGDNGHSYRFYSLAQDWARNREPPKTAPDTFTTIDTVPPESVLVPLPTFVPGPDFTVSWTGTDATSGIAGFSVFVSENFGPFETWMSDSPNGSAVFQGLEGHQYTFCVRASDRAGNLEESPLPEEFATTRVDGSAPSTTLVIGTPRFGVDPVFVSPSTAFELKTTDNYSGTNRTFLSIDDRPAHEYNGSFVETDPGFHNITYWSRDAAGNEETPRAVRFFVDSGPPQTELGYDGASLGMDDRTYISGATRIRFAAMDDGSGVMKTSYRIDGIDGGSYFEPFSIGKQGSHVLIFHSVDNLGFSEPEKIWTIVVDVYPPVTKAAANKTISNKDVEVTFAASDSDSGVAGTYYRIGKKGNQPGEFQPGRDLVLPAPANHSLDGTYSIEYFSIDRVGNRETIRALEITVDTRCELKLLFNNGLTVGESPFEAKGSTEPGAKVFINGKQVDVRPNGNFSLPLDLNPGRNRITVSATDLAGNSATETVYVYINGPSAVPDWTLLLISASIIIIIVIALVIWIKRRKRPEPEYETF